MAEAELAGIAEQQIEAHRGDDENAGRDRDVQEVLIAQPQRDGREHQQPEQREQRASSDALRPREQAGRA